MNARRLGSDARTYVLIGDGESAEGSVWEAAQAGEHLELDNLCGITDVNGLGQSRPTQWGHDLGAFAQRWQAFGWHAIVVDGHDVGAVLDAFREARRTKGRPTMILARTLKGKGIPLMEGKDGWHGKAIEKGPDLDRIIEALATQLVAGAVTPSIPPPPARVSARVTGGGALPDPSYPLGAKVATREAYGTALAALGSIEPSGGRARCRRRELDIQPDVRAGPPGPILRDLHRRAGDGRCRRRPGQPGGDPVSLDLRLFPVARIRFHTDGRDR